jgi:drug/metabolite transporter (DMT)-like permease
MVNLAAFSLKSVLAVLYLITVGSTAYVCYVWLLRVSTPALAGTYAFVNPVIAVFLGWLLAGEQLSAQALVAALVIVSAVILITKAKARQRLETKPRPTGRRLGELDGEPACETE